MDTALINPLNFIIIHVHDAGRYISPYAPGIPAPHLEQLAGESVVFDQAFSCAPTCSPSRAAMLTGYYPHEVGMLGLAHRGFSLERTDLHLANLLSSAGWETVLSGVQHETSHWQDLGYDRYIGDDPEAMFKPGFTADDWDAAQADGVIEFLEQRDHSAVKDQPFFLFWGLYNPHRPYPDVCAESHAAADADYEIPLPQNLPDTPAVRRDMRAYCRAVSAADCQIGRVLDVFLQSRYQENTLLICTTDHGIAFPGHKCTLYDTGCAVSFIVRPPGSQQGPRTRSSESKNTGDDMCRCRKIISHLDTVPTILDYANIQAEYRGDGFSLRPLLEGIHAGEEQSAETPQKHDALFWEINYHAAYEPVRSVRTRKYKYIRRFGSDAYPYVIAANIDDSPSKEELLRTAGSSDYRKKRVRAEEELYDLENDPLEQMNLAENSADAGTLQEMKLLLYEWMKRTDDPLLKGSVPAPEQAAVDALDRYSPQ